ncbi:exported protein of unknown function [Paraburkholderia kururiensis]|uniref:hypothetical protein n=1 Tax=Paraburkholderia kururiensis TaxID=984307 RepID=UPI0039A586BD
MKTYKAILLAALLAQLLPGVALAQISKIEGPAAADVTAGCDSSCCWAKNNGSKKVEVTFFMAVNSSVKMLDLMPSEQRYAISFGKCVVKGAFSAVANYS